LSLSGSEPAQAVTGHESTSRRGGCFPSRHERRPKDVLRGPVRGLLVNLGRHMDVQIGSRRYRRVPKPLLDDL
jgi:hypothetical protein